MEDDDGRLGDNEMLLEDKRETLAAGSEDNGRKRSKSLRLRPVLAIFCLILLLLITFGGGLLLGWKLFDELHKSSESSRSSRRYNWGSSIVVNGSTVAVEEWIGNNLMTEKIRENLRFLTEKPHIAGKKRNSELARSLYDQWKDYEGFDSVEMSNYSVLLDYVNRSNYNVLTLQDSNGATLYVANTTQEKPLTEGEDDPDVPPPFNAYSGVGQAKGSLVYVNYAEVQDFTFLRQNLSLNISGQICIARYGNIFRANKAKLAQENGCSGLIIYSDPIDYAPSYGPPVFPDGPMLPPSGLQRGSLLISEGDPQTPGLPSIDMVKRMPFEKTVENGDAPSIPVQPISYGDALIFMRQLSRHPVPKEWKGGLDIDYYVAQSEENMNITLLEVNNIRKEAVINDVIGIIYGSIEPDHLVILGNHRDAWTFGAVDPNSGTAVLMEIARVLNELRKKDWRPGRTIILCSWDAEEYGLIGSTEWVENYKKVLGANTVAYLNVDIAVSGRSHVSVSASPLLFNLVYEATKQVPCPDGCDGTVYDQWVHWFPDTDKPYIGNLGSGSDFASFVQQVGISGVDLTYRSADNFSYYAVYHSVHDNFYWASNFGDPNFTHHKAIGDLWSRVTIALTTSPLLPYDPSDYTVRLRSLFAELIDVHGATLDRHNISTNLLNKTLEQFSKAANDLKSSLNNYSKTDDDRIIRILNKKLINLERAFILAEGLPGTPYRKHVIAAPSTVNSYAGGSFPGVTDAIFNALTSDDWDEVHRQLDIVAVHILYGTQIMEQSDLKYLVQF